MFNDNLADYIIRFKDYIISERNLSDNTCDAYYSDLLQFKDYIINYCSFDSIDDVFDPDFMSEYIVFLSSSGLENRSVLRKLSAISLFIKFLKIEGVIEAAHMSSFDRPKIASKLPDYLTLEEIELFLSQFDCKTPVSQRDRALYELLYSCGLRVSEVSRLDIKDLYLDNNLIKVRGKGAKERFVPLGGMAKVLLNEYIAEGRQILLKNNKMGQAVFVNYKGDRLSRKGIWKNLKINGVKAGISKDFTVHTLRHSFATHLIQNGADIRFVQQFLGHENISTTEIYTHLDMRDIRAVYEIIHIHS